MRKDIINIVDILSKQSGGLDFRYLECCNLILDYCKQTKTRPKEHNYDLINGCLFINNNIIKRVEPLPPKPKFDEYLYYLNGKLIK